MRRLGLMMTLLAISALPRAGVAQDATAPAFTDWEAIVVGQPGPGAQGSFADAFHASQALEKGGIFVRDMIRDMPRSRLTDTLAGLEGVPKLVLYYSGRIPSGSISMMDGTMPLETVLKAAAQAGTQQVLLLVENCTDHTPKPSQVILPDAPRGMALQVVASAAADGTCTPGTRLSDQLKGLSQEAGLEGDLLAMLHGLDVTGALPDTVAMTGPRDFDVDVEEVVEFLPDDVVQLPVLDGDFSLSGDPVLIDEDLIEVVLPAQAPPPPAEEDAQLIRVTFNSLPQAQMAALPIAAGLPEPSILVGLIEGVTEASLSTEVDTEPTALAAFVDDNRAIAVSLAQLRKMSKDNPDLYKSMLTAGTFDPPEGRILAKVIQTELGRMNCYLGGIDGDFGRGSQRGSQTYYEELEKRQIAALDSPDASIDLFRLILGTPEVDCPRPKPQPVAATRSKTPSATSTRRTAATSTARSTNRAATTTRSAPAARSTPAPAPRSSGGSFGGSNFGGVFR